MAELEIPEGVKIEFPAEGEVKISGKLGSTTKRFNTALLSISIEGNKLKLEKKENKKLAKKASLAETALASEIRSAMKGVQEGIVRRMRILYSHFPMSFEVKDGYVNIKNFFGEHLPRRAKIVGDTKVEIKGQELIVRGVDPYDVGQTVANLFKLSFLKDKDPRVFQDGIYPIKEEE